MMCRAHRWLAILRLCLASVPSLAKENERPISETLQAVEFFEKQVQPILEQHCFGLTYPHHGRDYRLTDVYGHVV